MSSIVARTTSLYQRWRRWRLPYAEVMSAADYRDVVKAPPMAEGMTTLFGRKLRYSDNIGLLHSIKEIFYDEVYRFDSARPDPLIIDAGANIGLSVIYFKNMFPDARIIAYEPDPQMFEILRENTAHLTNVDLRNKAAWISDDDLTFYTEGSLAGSSEIDFLGNVQAITVKAERLKDALQRDQVDFLKIDIEGAENKVLFDIKEELASIDKLFFEYHSHPDSPQLLGDILCMIGQSGFRYAINGAHAPRLPFVERFPHGFDLQLNVFCMRDDRVAG